MPFVVSDSGRTTAWFTRLSRMYFSVSLVFGLRFCVPRRRMMVYAISGTSGGRGGRGRDALDAALRDGAGSGDALGAGDHGDARALALGHLDVGDAAERVEQRLGVVRRGARLAA